MEYIARLFGLVMMSWVVVSCAQPPAPDMVVPSKMTRQLVTERVSAVVVTNRADIQSWMHGNFSVKRAPKDADGGSAAPISPDGYFLTADHVLSRLQDRNVFLIFGQGHKRLQTMKARVVWRSESSDLALLHVDLKTPYYYRWSSPEKWLPAGTFVIHGGISTGFKNAVGKLGTSLSPESPMTGTRSFKMDIPLQPGDSGGPIVNAYGELVGINSAVEFLVPMETAFFVDSEGNRPNTRSIEEIIAEDRSRRQAATP
ncbi:MAG: S1C family serine protease [Luteolibacter sp.]